MTAEPGSLSLKCPVCGAGFRAAAACPRCGANLTQVMRIAARAYRARQEARSALLAGDVKRALHWQAAARRAHRPGPSPRNEQMLIRFADSARGNAAPASVMPAEAPADAPPPAPTPGLPAPPAASPAPVAEHPPARDHSWAGIASLLQSLWERTHSR